MWRVLLLLIIVPMILSGCGGPPVNLAPVRGTVTFEDGTVPQGEVATIYFEPAEDGPQPIRKAASGEIGPDGSFQLGTERPGDGVIPGKYKVCFAIERTYLGKESLVPARYTTPGETPFEVTVEPRGNDPFHFTLERQ